MSGHQIGQKPLVCLGIDLQRPVDRTTPGKWPHIENVVALVDGSVSPRPGLGTSALATGPAAKTPWHSIRTLNDPTGGAGVWLRVHGIQDRLAVELSTGVGTIVDKLGGWSGNPLSMVQGRPTESPQPYMYVADSALMRKVDRAGNLKAIGLPGPAAPPTAINNPLYFKTIDLFNAVTGWAQAGGAAAPTLLSVVATRPVNTTTPATNGYVWEAFGHTVIAPTSMTNIVVGSVLAIADTAPGTSTVIVEAIHSGSAAIAITGILYDSGTTGMCSITLATSASMIDIDSALLITGVASAGTELVRVVDVIRGADGQIALRVSTSVARLATDTITAMPSFVVNMGNPPIAGGAIQNDGVRTSVAAATTAGTPASLSKVATLDLSAISSAITGGSALDDYMSIQFRISNPSLLTEIRIMLDCDSASVSAGAFTGTEFTKNYFVKSISPSDLTGMLAYTQTAIANRQDQIAKRSVDPAKRLFSPGPRESIGRIPHLRDNPEDFPNFIDETPFDSYDFPDIGETNPGPTYVGKLKPGDAQFSTVRFRLREMQRVGSDESRGFKDIVGLRVAFITTAANVLDMHGWVLQGGYEPEVDQLSSGYEYRYRGRDSTTGVVSNASPASLGPVRPLRQSVMVTLTQHPSAEVDKLDVERRGGGVGGWRLVGTVANGATPSFTDTISNAAAEATFESEASGLRRCQPWPLLQKPQTGSSAVCSGTLIYSAAAPWSLSLLRGTAIVANGRQTYLRRVLATSMLEVEDSVGQSSSTTWEIPRPVYAGQPLAILIGGDWDQNRLLALGDPSDPSAYYLTHRANYDSTDEYLRFEIPGAILQNGVVYNGSPYLWSTEHLYRIDDAGVDAFGNLQLRAVVVPGARGLIAKWACCAGDRMYWLDREGICASEGGAPIVLTAEDLYPLFPHEGTSTQGSTVNGILAPNLAAAQEANLRLSHGADRLRFLYVDSGGTRRELEFRMRPGDAPSGWYPHVYTPGIASAYYEEGPGKHAWLMGGTEATAKLYALTDAQSDGGTAIVATGTPQYENVGDPRKRKRWGDYTTEVDRDGATVTVTPKFDNGLTAATLVSLTTGTGRVITIGDLGTVPAGSGVLATNMSLVFSMSVTTQRPKLYMWEPTWLDRPEVTQLRATDFEDAEPRGPKLVRGVWLTFDSLGATRAASVYKDGSLAATAATITSITSTSGPKRQFFAFATPFYATTLLVLPTDANSWMLFGVDWLADQAPESSDGPEAWTDLGYAGAKWVQGVVVDCDTENATVNLVVEGDEVATLATIASVNHNGRAQKAYTFDPPFLTHLVRLNPSAAIRLWPTPPTRWVWEPEPELGEHYETQQTTHDIPEMYKILRDACITLRSTSTVTFSIYDGSLGTGSTALFSTTIATTAGLRLSTYIPISAIKAKSLIYVLDGAGTGFALYRRDTWVRVKGWGRTVSILGGEKSSDWQSVSPFGADSRINGALI